ncbi:PREDICTED: adhesion G protein-coupled receptor L2-like isoform X3 [Branchiostoma belcheri]|uniref:Adhesion G protein-coupled receptor L2-like isoform X3 n=1 Tax=Branchiostoma belcheri TaxID=7741 RepID=A0A6P4YPM4_BRABE|nr:PREDICTED: adhesion G protein-coupled receptor L2-like isoform X3 [Branchiostoma belcheri]
MDVTSLPPADATMSTQSGCPAIEKRDIQWPATARGEWSTQPCPEGTEGTARWKCDGSRWTGEPDLSDCTSPWVNELYDLLNGGGPAGDILALVSGNLLGQGKVRGGDVIKSIDLLNVLVQRQEEQLVNMTQEEKKGTVTNFTQDDWSQVATGVIGSAEGSGFLVAKSLPDEAFSSVQDNLVMEVLPATGDSRRFPSGLSSDWGNVTDSVSLPATNQQVVALLYGDSLGTYLKPSAANRTVNSRIISASLGNGSTPGQLGDNQKVTIVLQHTDINFGFLIIALRVVYSHKSGKKMKHFKTGTKFKSWIRGSLTLLCLLGVTWVFGVLYLDKGTVVFAYVFTVTNSLQGLFIFIFHCLLNEKVQGELIRCFAQCSCCPEFLRQKYLERGSGTYVHHSGQSHRLHQNTIKTDSSGSSNSTRLNNTLDSHKVPLAITNGVKRRNMDVAIPGHQSALTPVEPKPFEQGVHYPLPHPGYREFSHSWEMSSISGKNHPASPYRGEIHNGSVNFQIDI